MVIFGAGASHDSAQAFRLPRRSEGMGNQSIPAPYVAPERGEPWRPPLAKDLFLDRHQVFGEIVRKYPKLTHILPALREPTGGKSVEKTLEAIQYEARNSSETKRELASVRFYLCELLNKITNEWLARTDCVTNYAPLLRKIQMFRPAAEEICLVTFNYDMLLEHALYSFEFKPRIPKDFLDSHRFFKLFKLHGSTDWARLVDGLPRETRLQPQHLIDQFPDLKLSGEFVKAVATNPGEMFTFHQPIFPAIAVPVETKTGDSFECPAYHMHVLSEMLKKVTKVLIIGWQAKEAHFNQMLRDASPNVRAVMVVGQDAADATRTAQLFLEDVQWRPAHVEFGQGGFTDFIVREEGDRFFRMAP